MRDIQPILFCLLTLFVVLSSISSQDSPWTLPKSSLPFSAEKSPVVKVDVKLIGDKKSPAPRLATLPVVETPAKMR